MGVSITHFMRKPSPLSRLERASGARLGKPMPLRRKDTATGWKQPERCCRSYATRDISVWMAIQITIL